MSERDDVIAALGREVAAYSHPANNTKYAIYRALEYLVTHMGSPKGQEVWWCLRDQATGDENHCWRAEAWESQRLGKYAGGYEWCGAGSSNRKERAMTDEHPPRLSRDEIGVLALWAAKEAVGSFVPMVPSEYGLSDEDSFAVQEMLSTFADDFGNRMKEMADARNVSVRDLVRKVERYVW